MANQIIVSEDRNQITVVEGETRIVEVVTQGPQGPVGPSGPQGPSGSSILNQITSGSVTASVDIGSNVFRISTGAQPYLGLTYENSGIMRHQNSTPPYFTIFNNNGGVNMTPGAIGFIEIGGQRGGGGGTMVRFSGTYIGDGNSRNARLSIGTAQGTGFGTNQISIFKLSSGSFTNQPITIIGTSVDSYSTSSIDITGSYASRATTIINGGTGNSIVSFDYNGIPQTVLFPNGNWGINTFADGGQKLQVTGTTRLAGDTTITGSLTITGNITAQTLVVQTITSSVSFITGSTKFGSLLTNTHQFTGSVLVSGSMGIGTNTPAALLDVYSSANTNSSLQVGASQNVRVSINTQSANRFSLLTISRIGDGATSAVSIGVGTGPTSTSGVISTNNDSLIFGYNIGNAFTETFRINTSNRLLLGLTTDDGINRLQVVGSTFLSGSVTGSDMLIRGSGNTSALEVQNNSAGTIAQFRNDTRLTLGGKVDIGLTNILFNNYSNTLNILGIVPAASWASDGTGIWFFDRTASSTSGTLRQIRLGGIGSGFTPTSGTATHTHLEINSTISQSSATGITRGLYVNPTLTSAADWRSIEWSNNSGWGLYGSGTAPNYLAGDLRVNQTATTNAMIFASTTGRTNVVAIRAGGTATQSTSMGFFSNQMVNSANTVEYISFISNTDIATGTYTVPIVTSYFATSGTKSAGVTITNMYGFFAENTLIQGNNSFGFYGNIAASSSRWNLYMAGTADNYLAGNLGIGITPTVRLQVSGDTILKGSGATSATTALTVQNSSNTNLFRILNDGKVNFSNTGIPANSSFYLNISNGYVNYASAYLSSSFYTYQAFGSWEAYGADASTATILSIGGYRASQWAGITLHASGNEVMRVKQNGQVRFVPLASAPAGAEAGDVYYNSTDNKHYGYNGTTWNAFY